MAEKNIPKSLGNGALVPVDSRDLRIRSPLTDKTGLVSVMGALRTRVEDNSKLILIPDPLGVPPIYYEFKRDDLVGIDEIMIVSNGGSESFRLVRAWFRTGTLCLRCEVLSLGTSGLADAEKPY